jgi:hypothetical protein
MQALTVLLLEISYEAIHFPQDRHEMVPSLKKLVRWLRVMKTNNGMANRAYIITMNLLQKLVIHISVVRKRSSQCRINTRFPANLKIRISRTCCPKILLPPLLRICSTLMDRYQIYIPKSTLVWHRNKTATLYTTNTFHITTQCRTHSGCHSQRYKARSLWIRQPPSKNILSIRFLPTLRSPTSLVAIHNELDSL